MLRDKKISLFVIYGSMLALMLIGVLLKSEIYIVAIVGIFTAGHIAIFPQMNSAARNTLSDSKKHFQLSVLIFLLASSFISFLAAYIFFSNLGFSGVMLGTAAACAHMLVRRDTW
jgi:hypothetical protein